MPETGKSPRAAAPFSVSEVNLRIFDASEDRLALVGPDFRYLTVNRTFARMLEMQPEDLVGKRALDIFGLEYFERVARPNLEACFRGESRHFQRWYDFVAGRFFMAVAYYPCRERDGTVGAVLVSCRDMTEHQRIREQLEQSQLELSGILRAAPVGIGLSRDRVIQTANEGLLRMLGYSSEELVGESARKMYPDDAEFERVGRELYPETLREGWNQIEARMRTRDGRLLEVLVTATAFRPGEPDQGVAFSVQDISERSRATRALARSEALYRGILENLPDSAVFLLDTELHCQLARGRALEALGWTGEDLSGRRFDTIWEADEAQVARDCCRQALDGEEVSFVLECAGRAFDNLAVAIEDAEGRQAVLVIARDVTEQHRIVQALRASENKFSQLFQSTPDAVTLARLEDGKLLEVNGAFQGLFGFGREEALGRSGGEMGIWAVEPERQAALEMLREQGNVEDLEVTMRKRDGSLLHCSVSANPLVYENQPCVLWVLRDISERKRAEAEAEALQQKMQQAQKLESLGVLAGGIAHDFNNLLMTMLGNVDLALRDLSPSSPARSSMAEVEKAGRRAAELCKQMLAYSGRGKFVVANLDLSELIGEMQHLLEVSISKKTVLRFELEQGLPAVHGDAAQLRQVLVNLVTNASEAIGDRSGIVTVKTGAAYCDAQYLADTFLSEELEPGLYVSIEVADSGQGMDAETRARIFEPFFTTKFTGRGLGLAAVLGIARGHNGAIKVYSEPGKGSLIKVLLPAVEAASEPVEQPVEGRGDWQGGGTILLVDDEETIRALGGRMLEMIGFEVLTACDGREALEVYEEHAEAIVCVLMDLTMPHMDGEEAFRRLRRLDPALPIVISSGYNEQEVGYRFAGKKLSSFIQKPYRLDEVRGVLRSVLEGGESSDSA